MRYATNLVIAVVGDGDDLQEPVIRELFSILDALGIGTVGIRTI